MYAIVLGRVIPSEIFTNELNTDVVEKAVSTTPMIIQLINYIKHDVSLMARESIQDALSSRVEDILTILSQKHGELIVSSIMDVPFLKNDQRLCGAYKDKLREDKWMVEDVHLFQDIPTGKSAGISNGKELLHENMSKKRYLLQQHILVWSSLDPVT